MPDTPTKLMIQRWRRRARGPLLRGLIRMLAWLPLRVSHALGSALGMLIYSLSGELPRVARRNIALCFPHWTDTARARLARATLRENGKFFAESGRVWMASRSAFEKMIRRVHGKEYLQAALARGKGAFIVAPHQGSWEVVGLYMSILHPMTSMYRPPPVSALDEIVRNARQRFGAHLVPTDAGGVRKLMAALKENQLIGILPDQDPGHQTGEFIPFMGVPAYTMTLFTRLAQKSGTPALLCYAERLPRGRGFDIWIKPLPAELGNQDMTRALTELNEAVAALARSQPEQYLWTYRRFRTRPAGENSLYE